MVVCVKTPGGQESDSYQILSEIQCIQHAIKCCTVPSKKKREYNVHICAPSNDKAVKVLLILNKLIR